MKDGDILMLRGPEIDSLLAGREQEIIQTVRKAYETHAAGASSLPHSTFLRFPKEPRNRIIALPAYLGDGFETAGIKWVSSFPDNIKRGMDRASAVVILNSMATGRPESILEGSLISAKRTAASAALAGRCLHENARQLGMIGCGLINFEILRFITAANSEISRLVVYDIDGDRAARFKKKCEDAFRYSVTVVEDVKRVLGDCDLISFATTAGTPYVPELSNCAPGTAILHVSLRDLAPEAILACDNIVDDVDHVCRAETSVHLAEQLTGNRDFIRCTLGEILNGSAKAREDEQKAAVFSPFGLGILDLALSKLVFELAVKEGKGTVIESFLPASGQ